MGEERWSRWVIGAALAAGVAIFVAMPIIAFGWGYGVLAVLALLFLYGCDVLIDAVRARWKNRDRT